MRLLSFILGLLCSHMLFAQQDQTSSFEFNHFVNQYTEMMERKLVLNGIPGAALSVVQNGSGEIAYGYGKTKRLGGTAVNHDTRFRLASVSKTFAGSLAAKLASEQRFDLDDPVVKYLPNFDFHKRDKKLRVSHLLSHSSGLVPNAYDNLIESRMPYNDIISRLAKVEPICSPGRCYAYQNVMFSLIGDVIEKTTNIKYETWVEEFFFKPLNMKHASLGFEAMIKDNNYAHPHVRARKKWYTARLKPHYYKVAPAAGVNASASDMVQWLKAQLGQYPSVLSPYSLTLQNTPQTKTDKELRRRIWRKKLKQAHYGLGWRIYQYQDETIYYHSGWVQGYRADIVIIPRLEIGFSLMLNAEAGMINELTTDFLNLLLNKDNKKRA
jgi:beta-lactamase class C